jgi:hypothetical protein
MRRMAVSASIPRGARSGSSSVRPWLPWADCQRRKWRCLGDRIVAGPYDHHYNAYPNNGDDDCCPEGLDGSKGKGTIAFVAVPNVVGMTLAQANAALSAVGLVAGGAGSAKPSGQSATGTILAQSFAAGSLAEPGQVIPLTISGY